jgi:hypothetical protein
MQYLKLEKTEIKELRNITKENIRFFPIIFIFLSIIFAAFINLAPINLTKTFQLDSLHCFALTILISVIFIVIFFRDKVSYLKDIIANKKKIYGGILASKQHTSKNGNEKFYFYMDGNKFSVTKEDFEKYKEFDSIQFHLSIHSKYIFKISGDLKK